MSEILTTEDQAQNELVQLRAWLERHLATSIEARTSNYGGLKKEGYVVVAIPDWDVRQKLADINEALKGGAK